LAIRKLLNLAFEFRTFHLSSVSHTYVRFQRYRQPISLRKQGNIVALFLCTVRAAFPGAYFRPENIKGRSALQALR
jgi:hypothetical protein